MTEPSPTGRAADVVKAFRELSTGDQAAALSEIAPTAENRKDRAAEALKDFIGRPTERK